ncbi:acetylcholine receptor subunit beta-like [Ruditapes philippinarum]|uniref:acetylcholine receptor subunit beta-like n=1 Tax=Ruditapes philippinarum TaxID=129788 RepID=UPI00295C3929|nr:acetylcholine receptor subunit beta-like [Ruditapes philippinarum]
MFKIIVCVLLTSLYQETGAYSIDDESKLQTDLLTGYNINVRPADQVFVQCSLAINNLLSLDIVDQTLAVIGSLVVMWNDHRLSWNISQNGNVSNVYFKSGQIWRPTLALKNSCFSCSAWGLMYFAVPTDSGEKLSFCFDVVVVIDSYDDLGSGERYRQRHYRYRL